MTKLICYQFISHGYSHELKWELITTQGADDFAATLILVWLYTQEQKI